MNAAAFLDRDNTIIENDGDLGDPSKVVLIQGAASAIASLRGLGYKIVVITNQGGVARGKYGEADVEAMHRRINEILHETSNTKIDRFYYCPYHPEGTVEKYRREHPWRKPQPGMFLQAAKDMEIDLSQSWTIGDMMRDVEAGAAAGTRTILLHPDGRLLPPLKVGPIGTGAMQAQLEQRSVPDYTARNMIEAVRIIAQQRRPDRYDEIWEKAEASRPKPAKAVLPDQENLPEPAVKVAVRQPRPPRPFRPWDTAPADDPAQGPPALSPVPPVPPAPPVASAPVAAPVPPTEAPPVPTSAAAQAAHASVATTPQAPAIPATPAPAAPTAAPLSKVEPPARAVTPAPATPAPAAPVPSTPAAEPAPEALADSEPVDTEPAARTSDPTMRQILQELRSQRAAVADFSYLRMFAVVLQMLAFVCLLGALWLGGDSAETFARWISVTIFIQLATIAALLFDR